MKKPILFLIVSISSQAANNTTLEVTLGAHLSKQHAQLLSPFTHHKQIKCELIVAVPLESKKKLKEYMYGKIDQIHTFENNKVALTVQIEPDSVYSVYPVRMIQRIEGLT